LGRDQDHHHGLERLQELVILGWLEQAVTVVPHETELHKRFRQIPAVGQFRRQRVAIWGQALSQVRFAVESEVLNPNERETGARSIPEGAVMQYVALVPGSTLDEAGTGDCLDERTVHYADRLTADRLTADRLTVDQPDFEPYLDRLPRIRHGLPKFPKWAEWEEHWGRMECRELWPA
jgi:hypothetical protein